jgi:hypothetical protein
MRGAWPTVSPLDDGGLVPTGSTPGSRTFFAARRGGFPRSSSPANGAGLSRQFADHVFAD